MKAWLSHAGLPFEVRNVDTDLSACDELRARGFRTVPVTIVSERAIVAYQPEALAAAISGADPATG